MGQASRVTRKPRLVRFTDNLAPGRNLHYAGASTPHCPGAPAPSLLLVDDEACIRELLAVLFRREGYLVYLAGHGREALRILEEQHVDLLVTDVDMPVLGGPGLVERAWITSPQLPVLFLAGSGDAAPRLPKNSSARCEIVYKPFSMLHLLSTVERLLDVPSVGNPRVRPRFQRVLQH